MSLSSLVKASGRKALSGGVRAWSRASSGNLVQLKKKTPGEKTATVNSLSPTESLANVICVNDAQGKHSPEFTINYDSLETEWKSRVEKGSLAPSFRPIVKELELRQKRHVKRRVAGTFEDLDSGKILKVMKQLEQEKLYFPTWMEEICLIPHFNTFEKSYDLYDKVLTQIREAEVEVPPAGTEAEDGPDATDPDQEGNTLYAPPKPSAPKTEDGKVPKLSVSGKVFMDEALSAMLLAARKNPDHGATDRILKRFAEEDLKPSLEHWTSIITTHKELHSEPEDIDHTWQEMRSSGCKPGMLTYTEYIAACKKRAPSFVDKDRLRDEIKRAEQMFKMGTQDGNDLSFAAGLIIRMYANLPEGSENDFIKYVYNIDDDEDTSSGQRIRKFICTDMSYIADAERVIKKIREEARENENRRPSKSDKNRPSNSKSAS